MFIVSGSNLKAAQTEAEARSRKEGEEKEAAAREVAATRIQSARRGSLVRKQQSAKALSCTPIVRLPSIR